MEYYADLKSRTWIEVDEDALRHNVEAARLGGGQVMAVVKGDGYGLGVRALAERLERFGCKMFGVACLDEAVELRTVTDLPILILAYTPPEEAALLARYDLVQAVLDQEHALALEREAARLGVTLRTHLKLDTGMSRYGFAAQGPEAGQRAILEMLEVFSMPHLRVEGIFTHLSMADDPAHDDYTAWQLENFERVVDGLRGVGISGLLLHCSNSAAILFHPEAHFDVVRAGAMLYGMNPHGAVWEDGRLRQVLTWKARISQVRMLPAGARVSYGGLWSTERPSRIAVLPVGFADGLPRGWTGKGIPVTVHGRSCPIIGRICMDCCMIDVTEVPEVQRGDIVTLLGGDALSLDTAAARGGTNNLEPIILRGNRVPVLFVPGRKNGVTRDN